MNVELIYDEACPNVAAARAQLLRAFAAAGLPAKWREWRCEDPAAPPRVRGLGSPTILVDGLDVAGGAAPEAACCRLYETERGLSGVPSVEMILSALRAPGAPDAAGTGGRWRSLFGLLPGISFALLPKVACPACWPAYAGVLSALGLSFLLEARVFVPLTLGFLVLAVLVLAWGAGRSGRRGPLALGVAGALVVAVGKLAFDLEPATWIGVGLLVIASLWNARPPRRAPACPACLPRGAS